MTNKTKAAIEEDAKLPTAEEFFIVHAPSKNIPPDFYVNEIVELIESHTAAHTAALRSKIAQLDKDFCHCSAENSDMSSQLEGVRHDNDLLRERLKQLEAKIASYESAIDGLKKVVDSLVKIKSL